MQRGNFFVGRLVRDPEYGVTQNGTSICKFTLAVDEGYGEYKNTLFPNFEAWKGQADYLNNYARKGNLLAVGARYTEQRWQDNNNNNRLTIKHVVEQVKILSSKDENTSENAQNEPQSAQNNELGTTNSDYDYSGLQIASEDLPF